MAANWPRDTSDEPRLSTNKYALVLLKSPLVFLFTPPALHPFDQPIQSVCHIFLSLVLLKRTQE